MIVLTLRTDKPESEIGLYDGSRQLAYMVWPAHRQLAETLHMKMSELLTSQQKTLSDIVGIVCYKGPGSFTGLRIGVSVANALAFGLSIPIIGVENNEKWIDRGLQDILNGQNHTVVVPEYGAPVHITPPKD